MDRTGIAAPTSRGSGRAGTITCKDIAEEIRCYYVDCSSSVVVEHAPEDAMHRTVALSDVCGRDGDASNLSRNQVTAPKTGIMAIRIWQHSVTLPHKLAKSTATSHRACWQSKHSKNQAIKSSSMCESYYRSTSKHAQNNSTAALCRYLRAGQTGPCQEGVDVADEGNLLASGHRAGGDEGIAGFRQAEREVCRDQVEESDGLREAVDVRRAPRGQLLSPSLSKEVAVELARQLSHLDASTVRTPIKNPAHGGSESSGCTFHGVDNLNASEDAQKHLAHPIIEGRARGGGCR
eukprot:1151093-Rhodomonas_salina.2